MSEFDPDCEKGLYEQIKSVRQYRIKRTIIVSLLCVSVGIIAGLGSVGFRYLIDFFYNIFFHAKVNSHILRYPCI